MGLLNYSTQVKVENTVMEIEKILISSGAERILKEYTPTGEISSLSFTINIDNGTVPIKLPIQLEEVMQTINEQVETFVRKNHENRRVVPKKFKNDRDQARRVAWRIIKDWLEAQLAMIFLKQVKLQQVFLPYIVGLNGETLYEQIERTAFKGFLIEDRR